MQTWQDDFPISWVDDHYVTRREFTKSLVLVSCSAFAANGALVVGSALSSRSAPATPAAIPGALALPVGGSKVFGFPGPLDPCLLVRLGEERFVAFGQRCTHLGCPVIYREQKRDLYCPCHEGIFDGESGRVVAGPPPRPLPRVKLERRGDELWALEVQL